MPKFRKKPVVVEVWQVVAGIGPDDLDYPDWVIEAFRRPPGEIGSIRYSQGRDGIRVCTLEGVMEGPIGGRLIKGVRDELYLCDPAIFAETYETENTVTGIDYHKDMPRPQHSKGDTVWVPWWNDRKQRYEPKVGVIVALCFRDLTGMGWALTYDLAETATSGVGHQCAVGYYFGRRPQDLFKSEKACEDGLRDWVSDCQESVRDSYLLAEVRPHAYGIGREAHE